MRLSPVTRANLELTETLRGREKRGTLLWVLDKTSTSMGKRMLRSWIEQPLISSALINHRLNAVESLVKQTMARGDLTEELGYIADMERLMTRTVYGSATPKEIYTLAQTCDRLPACAGWLRPAAARSLLNWQYRSIRWRTSRPVFMRRWTRKRPLPSRMAVSLPKATMPRWTSCVPSATIPRAFWRSWKPPAAGDRHPQAEDRL